MKLKYELTSVDRTKKCVISNRSSIDKVAAVFEKLDAEHQKMFKACCFGKLLELCEMKVNQIAHQLIMRLAKSDREGAIWFVVGGKPVRFSLKEFTLITGLNVGEVDIVDQEKGKSSRIVTTYFKKRTTIKRKHLFNVFNDVRIQNETDRYKLGLLVVMVFVVLGCEENHTLDWWWFHLVEDLDAFNKYPWGNLSYQSTIHVLNRDLNDCFKKDVIKYAFYGFPYAFMVWALEAIPCLQKFGTLVNERALPRMLRWEVQKSMNSAKIEELLQSEQIQVLPMLLPSKAEKRKPYYVALTEHIDCSEYEDATEDNMESAFPTQECPQPEIASGFDEDKVKDVVVKVVREENKAIYAMLDAIEKKIDLLVSNLCCEKCKNVINPFSDIVGGHKKEEFEGKEPNMAEEDMMAEVGCNEEKECESKESDMMAEDMKGKNAIDDPAIEEKTVNLVEVEDEETEEDASSLFVKFGPSLVQKVVHVEAKPPISPLKIRKLNVDVYDPYREADPVLMECYEKWLVEVEDSCLVQLVDDDVQLSSLKSVGDDGPMPSNILDSALCEIRRRSKAYPDLFEQDACILDSNFANYVKAAFKKVVEVKKGRKRSRNDKMKPKTISTKLLRTLLNYVNGRVPNVSKPWVVCRYLYVPIVVSSHWFVLRIDLNGRKICVYDSLPGHVKKSVLDGWLEPIQVGIPFILKTYLEGHVDYSLEKFAVEKVTGLPVQENGVDCGIFALKWIEFLTGRQDVLSLRVDYIPKWRKKLVAELLAGRFEP